MTSNELTRRGLVGGLGAATLLGAVPATASAKQGKAADSPMLWMQPERTGAPAVTGLHLQYGADASREAVVSWHTTELVSSPRVLLGRPTEGFGRAIPARTVHYRDAQSGTEVFAHHAVLSHLVPGTTYLYAAMHDGATPEPGLLQTAPSGRAPFTFTSFGDQGTPTTGKLQGPPPAHITGALTYVNDNLGSPFGADVTAAVERRAPLLHLVNGDLCYANLSQDRIRTWRDWFELNTRSARFRPWMPAAGNHENERGNGPIGFGAYQTLFHLPDNGGGEETRGLWYAFTVGSVRFISLNNDDVCYQDGGNSYVRGYSGGAQRRFLEDELKAARSSRSIDWIIVVMHQVVISTADHPGNGADLGIRQEFVPLFDKYQVDIVLCGHEHHYERSHPLRGLQPNDTATPIPAATDVESIDSSQGTVHMIIGGGGSSIPSNSLLFDTPQCNVITGVGPVGSNGKRPPIYLAEDAPWSAVRDRVNPYGFVEFSVDPGHRPGGTTTITATYLAVQGPYGETTPVDTFTLHRKRSDGGSGHAGALS